MNIETHAFDIEKHNLATDLHNFKTILTGGIIFLLPIIVIGFLLDKAIELIQRLVRPITNAIGIQSVGGVAFGTILAIVLLVLVAFLAGLLARTRHGQATFSMLENSILGMLPQLRMARGIVESLDAERQSEIEVVLVRTDAGLCLGFVLERPDGDWWSVFVPAAPQWTSGAVVYAHFEDIRQTGLTFTEAIMLMRRCGSGSAKIREILASLQDKGEVGPLR
jgi:uncharacterized membrane protein